MAVALVVLVMLGVAVVVGLRARQLEPLVTMAFALVMAVAGGALFLRGDRGVQWPNLLGTTLVLVAVVAAIAGLLPDRTASPRPAKESNSDVA